MPHTWDFTNQTTTVDFTDEVQSATVVKGRATQDDQYAPGGLTFTIRNQSDQAAGFTLNDIIKNRHRRFLPKSFGLKKFCLTTVPLQVSIQQPRLFVTTFWA